MQKTAKKGKKGAKNVDFTLFLPKTNCMVKMTTPYPNPYCALIVCKILVKNNEPFFRYCKKGEKRAKKGKQGAKNADFSRTEISTAKPMVVGCVQHSTHFIKQIGRSLETFFHKVQKNCKKGQKRANKGKKGGF